MELARYEVLDTAREEVFERITRLAARLLGMPLAAINFIDIDRHWGKAATGFEPGEAPRSVSFCAWTILSDEPTVIPDMTQDRRFSDHPAVIHQPQVRTYAGAPLRTASGNRIGTLCVMGTETRSYTPEELQALQDLAATAMTELDLRLQLRLVNRELEVQHDRTTEFKRTLAHAQTLEAVNTLVDLPLNPDEVALQAAGLVGEAIQANWAGIVVYKNGLPFTRRSYATPGLPAVLHDLAEHIDTAKSSVSLTLTDLTEPLYMDRYAASSAAVPAAVEAGLQSVSWVPLGRWEDQVFHLLLFRTGEPRQRPWRESDRSLLEAAARTVKASLHRRAALDAAEKLARLDALTGVNNRRAFDQDLRRWQEEEEDVLLVMIDLDGFKKINDTEGHAQGDRILKVFGNMLGTVVSAGSVYRLGGDEFALLLPPELEPGEVEESIDLAVLTAAQISVGRIGASMGMARWSEAGEGEDMVQLADRRMYQAKKHRKGIVGSERN